MRWFMKFSGHFVGKSVMQHVDPYWDWTFAFSIHVIQMIEFSMRQGLNARKFSVALRSNARRKFILRCLRSRNWGLINFQFYFFRHPLPKICMASSFAHSNHPEHCNRCFATLNSKLLHLVKTVKDDFY